MSTFFLFTLYVLKLLKLIPKLHDNHLLAENFLVDQMTKYSSKSWSFTPCYTFFNVGHDLVMDLDLDSIFVIKYYLDILKGNSQPIDLFLFWLPMCCSILKWYLCGSDVSIIAPAKITKQNYTLGIKNLLLCKGTVCSTCHFTI